MPTRPIPPGEEGKITVKVDTRSYGGSRIHKQILVYTNEPDDRRHQLDISGSVERFAHITPGRVVLRGPAGKPLAQTITIQQREGLPFKIIGHSARIGKHISYRLTQVRDRQPFEWTLKVENRMTTPGRYFDTIYLETNSSAQAKIAISVIGEITQD